MNLKVLIKIIVSCLCAVVSSTAQSVSGLQAKLDKTVSASIFENANISFSVFDVEQRKEVVSHRSEKVLSPASSFKLFTTLTALKNLGADYTFQTVLGHTGTIDSTGLLKGDLIVKGGGDPTLGSSRIAGNPDFKSIIKSMVAAIILKGITCVQGQLIIDESIFDSYPVAPSWQWNDLGNYYASGAWGLNVNENQYTIYFKDRGVIGTRPNIHSVSPIVKKLNLSNELLVDSTHTGDQAYIFGGPYNYDKRIVGTIPQGAGTFSIKGSIPDPPYFFATYLKKALEEANIQVPSIQTSFRPIKNKLNQIATYPSPPLKEIVKKANFDSNNLYTEALIKILGKETNGQGSGQNGLVAVKKLLRAYKVKVDHLNFNDGSGLSARNLISAKAFAQFLAGLSEDLSMKEITQYIPKAGISGTVRGMLTNSTARGNIWMKSGSMESIQSYTGYVNATNRKWYSFSFIVNGYSEEYRTVRSIIEKLIEAIYLQPPS